MRPDILPGDTVVVEPAKKTGMVIAVTPANNVPDAAARGLSTDTLGWSFYVMVSQPVRFIGPVRRAELQRVS